MLAGKPTPEWLQHREDPVTVERADGQEVPAQKWVDVTDGKVGFALMNRSKYGHCYDKGELRLTLLRSAGNPDEYPNLGKFNIQYSIMPHTGDWTNGVMLAGLDYNLPIYASEPLSTSLEKKNARMPAEQQLISIDKPNVLLSTIKKAEDSNELIVRVCEMTGRETPVCLSLPYRIVSARRVSLLEFPMSGTDKPQYKGQDVNITLKPHEIATLALQLK
jgi:alpha-mannosidase